MPPKPAPKLTKKQIQEQKKQQLRLQKQKQQQQAAAERERLQEEERLRQIERKKRSEEERVRIVQEKEKYYPMLEERVKSESESYQKLLQEEKWKNFTTPYIKDYSVQGTSLSTFLNIFTTHKPKTATQTLHQCEQSEKYITKLHQKILTNRSQYNHQGQQQNLKLIQKLQQQQLNKLQHIMIQFANAAEQMEEKNVDEAKKKNQQNAAQKAMKPIDSVFQMSDNFKIGMYINTISTKNYNKFNPVAIKEFGFNSEVPPKWTNNTAIVKFQWVNFNHFSSHQRQQFRIVGGVFNLQFYDMFVGTKKTNNISIKKYYKGKQILQKFKLQPSAIKQPFKIMYQIPKYIFMTPYTKSTIKLAQYDVSLNRWMLISNENITEYMEQEKRVICRISKPQPVAFVENWCADYPYVAWELRTVEQGKVLMDFQLRRTVPNKNGELQQIMIQFEIGPNVMKLQLDTVYPELKDLTQSYTTPQYLLYQLSRRGIHLLPVDQDHQHSGLKPKDRQAQKNAIRDIAYAVQAFSIRSETNDSRDIRVKIRENVDYENVFLEDQEKDWKRIRWGDGDKCWVDGRGIMERHCNLQTLLEVHDEICLKQCVDRMKFNKEYLLRKTVMKVLELTRVLAFTASNDNIKSKLVDVLKEKLIVS